MEDDGSLAEAFWLVARRLRHQSREALAPWGVAPSHLRALGVLLRHGGLTNNSRFGTERLGLRDGGVWLNAMPMFHLGGCGITTLGPIIRRGTQVNVERFVPGLVLELLEAERVEMFGAVPTMLLALIEHDDFPRRDLSALRRNPVTSFGITLTEALAQQWQRCWRSL